MAELAVSSTEPITTKRMLGSLKEKNSKSEFISLRGLEILPFG
jgi:hypothetical protein